MVAKRKAKKKPAVKRGRGRPTKYRPEMCEKVRVLMKAGMSHAQVCLELKIGSSTMKDWVKSRPEFASAVKDGDTLSEAEWTRIGHEMALAGNVTSWIFNMKNRFGWHDRQALELTGAEGGPIKTEVLGDWTPLIGTNPDDVDGDDDE